MIEEVDRFLAETQLQEAFKKIFMSGWLSSKQFGENLTDVPDYVWEIFYNLEVEVMEIVGDFVSKMVEEHVKSINGVAINLLGEDWAALFMAGVAESLKGEPPTPYPQGGTLEE